MPALRALVENANFDVVRVITQPDRPVGRKQILTPSPVKKIATELGISILQPEKLKDQALDNIIALGAELAVVVAYGNLIPKRLLEALPRGFVNIHPSLLPKYRGASPITAAILEGDKETGVCLMVLDEGMDHGPVITCRRVDLKGDETTTSLSATLAPVGAEMIGKELIDYLNGKTEPKPQDNDQATFCKLIESDSAKIDWQKSVTEIDRVVRAMHGVTPAWTMFDGAMLLIHSASIYEKNNNVSVHSLKVGEGKVVYEPPGTIVVLDKKLTVACADGHIILNEIQLAGGKPMPGQVFLNGHQDFIGKVLK